MFSVIAAAQVTNQRRPGSRLRLVAARMFLLSSLMGLVLVGPGRAGPMITLGPGVKNPPPSLDSTGLNPKQTAVADTASLVPLAPFLGLLQSVLNAQGFTNANNWTLVPNAVTIDNNATFNITDYHLFLNATGTAFGENIDFKLNPNLAAPKNVPAGSTVTEHWLQLLHESRIVNGFGFPIAGQQGFWKYDNGNKAGGPAAGAGTGPYYDSNAPGGGFSVPPTFHDAPQFFSGAGFYFHADVFPIWDVFTPGAAGKPATESIDIADFGLAWGFTIVPEPSSIVLIVIGSSSIGMARLLKRKKQTAA